MKDMKGMKEMKKSADLAAACGGQPMCGSQRPTRPLALSCMVLSGRSLPHIAPGEAGQPGQRVSTRPVTFEKSFFVFFAVHALGTQLRVASRLDGAT
jgi:hypothetical protein